MASDESETESQPASANHQRGKNFSIAEDTQICLSWIHVHGLADQQQPSFGALYDHAASIEKDLRARTAKSIRCRFFAIQRDVRKFSDIYKQLEDDEPNTTTESESAESVLQKALKAYKVKYGTYFKYLQCWGILKGHAKFPQLSESSSNIAVEAMDEESVAKKRPKIIAPERDDSGRKGRGLNILSDEIQAILKACRDLGVEEARSKGERIEPLLYDIQQQMANYGRFPERKLYLLKVHYFRTEKSYRMGALVPYPPEARLLWGKIDGSMDDETNDASWNKHIQYIVDYRRGLSFLSELELQELLKEALKRNAESVPQAKRRTVFHQMLSTLHSNQLCRRKNAEQLQQDYLRLKQQFTTGKCKYLPPEASQLWKPGEVEEHLVEEKHIIQPVGPDPLLQISFADCTTKAEVLDLCRICREPTDQTKDLFSDMFKNETYAAIIKNILNIEITNHALYSTVICGHCSTFIEGLVKFVHQCRENSIINESYSEDITFGKEEIIEFDVSVEFNNDLNDDSKDIVSADDVIDDEGDHYTNANANVSDVDDKSMDGIMTAPEVIPNEENTAEEVLDEEARKKRNYRKYLASRKSSRRITSAPEAIPNEDSTAEEVRDEEARKKRNYRKYLASRKSSRRQNYKPAMKQCHLCGKKLRELSEHLQSHNEEGLKCDVCGRVCPNRRQLRVHRNRHTKERVFQCRIENCDRVFYVWSSRKNHEETHKNSSWKCEFCGMKYAHKSYLEKHRKVIHLGMRNLKCTECHFSTSIKVRLLNHFRSMHTSERPFKCPVCDHTSNNSTGYYIHFQRHKKSGERADFSIECAYCRELFTKDAALEAHIVKEHPDRAVTI